MDCTEVGDEVELQYECYCLGYTAYNNRFCTHQLGGSADLTYCFFTPYCKDCFGCVGQHHGRYRIFNKQYTEEEYEVLKEKIIEHMKQTGEWGEFFPAQISPQGYNETMAMEHFPLTKEEAVARGYKWKDETPGAKYEGPKYEIPNDIADVEDSIVDAVLTCEKSGKHYRILKSELKFYRSMNIPVPTRCPEVRYKQRKSLRNERVLYDRKCADCQCDMQTTYVSDCPEKVLCDSCYQKAVN